MKLLYRLFYKGFIRYHETRKNTKDNLVYAFTDFDLNNYYTWSAREDMPKCRYERLINLTMWWEANISPNTLEIIRDGIIMAADASLTEPKVIDRSKAISRVILFANELTLRKDEGVPSAIFHEIAAVMAVREDEDPSIINEQIHREKVETFARETSAGRDFFLQMPMLLKHLDLWRLSRTELKKLFAKSEAKEKMTLEVVNRLLSELKLSTEAKANGH